jgi:UDP-N-acetylglucosamine 2-epimerase (non-hydrolysing)
MNKLLFIFGTRPEAIKLAPLINILKKETSFKVSVCVTAQHRQMLDQVLELFKITPDIDLNLMKPNQDLTGVTCEVLTAIQKVYAEVKPDMVIVQGDTTTTFAAALGAFYNKIPVAHVEAGLRTWNMQAPWPEEMNRVFTSKITDLHFAPTEVSKNNLLKDGIGPDSIFVTGNTVIDALFETCEILKQNVTQQQAFEKQFSFLDPQKKLILMTGHRRENFGQGFINICESVRELAEREDIQIVYPVHLNPNVQDPVKRILGNHPRISLIEPLDYFPFVYLMQRSYLILTDSGGVQEEAPSLGKPVLVMRDVTERPEAVDVGTVLLVGTNKEKIIRNVNHLLDDTEAYESFTRIHNPYGDGLASKRIMNILLDHYGLESEDLKVFSPPQKIAV